MTQAETSKVLLDVVWSVSLFPSCRDFLSPSTVVFDVNQLCPQPEIALLDVSSRNDP